MKLKLDRATYKAPEAAAVSGMGENKIRAGVKAGIIPSIPGTRTILIPKAAFHRWLDSGGQVDRGTAA